MDKNNPGRPLAAATLLALVALASGCGGHQSRVHKGAIEDTEKGSIVQFVTVGGLESLSVDMTQPFELKTDVPYYNAIVVELKGAGNSVAQMLGSSNGKIGFFMDGGQISEFMMELVALDLWGVAKAELKGDKPVEVRARDIQADADVEILEPDAHIATVAELLRNGAPPHLGRTVHFRQRIE